MEFILNPEKDGCFLCNAAGEDRDEENLILHRAAECFCIMNRYPYNNGHLLMAPYRHVADLDDLTEGEMLALMQLLRASKAALARVMSPDGFNIGVNLGRSAGAGLEAHLHLHIVPRWQGDTNFMPVFAEAKVIPQALSALWTQLRGAWPDTRKADPTC